MPPVAAGPLHVCQVIHDLGAGGAEDLLVDLARVAERAELELSVLSLMPADDAIHAMRLRDLGVAVRSLDLRSRWDPRAVRRATRLLARLGPDIVHTHLKHADLVGGTAARRLGIPSVSTLHVIEDDVGPLGALKRRAGARARARHAAVTIAVSDAVRRWYLATFPVDAVRVVTIRNGVLPPSPLDPAARDALRAALGAGPDTVLAVMASVLRPGKGHDVLLRAVALLDPDVPVRVAVAGDGPLAATVRASAGTLGVTDRLTFLGFRDDVDALLQAADLVLQPSLADALPTTLIRALAAGTPAIASAVGGIPEIVVPDTGVLVPAGDPAALAAAIAALAADPGERARLAANARARFAAEFDASTWARRLADCYAEVVARQTPQTRAR